MREKRERKRERKRKRTRVSRYTGSFFVVCFCGYYMSACVDVNK